jgi:hypothetical protein
MINFLIDFGIVFAGPLVVKHDGHRRQDRTLGRVSSRRAYGIVGIGVAMRWTMTACGGSTVSACSVREYLKSSLGAKVLRAPAVERSGRRFCGDAERLVGFCGAGGEVPSPSQ